VPQRGGPALPARRRAIENQSPAAVPAIELRGVAKRFTQPRPWDEILRHPFARTRVQALEGIDLCVPRGGVTGLLGPNGSGKTTLLRVLATSLLPDQGEVRVLGLDALRAPHEVRRRVGVVLSDERSFYWRLTGAQNLIFFAALHGLDGRRARARVAELGGLLGLAAELDKPFRNLSTGWRHRLALARALLADPPVLLMDEPTAGLDPAAAERARRLLRERLAGELAKTVLVASHNLDEVRAVCDRVALLHQGRLRLEGPAAEALPRAAEWFAAQVGEEPA
jgi:ABC-2 type transport system ATP-binding protein